MKYNKIVKTISQSYKINELLINIDDEIKY